MTSSPPFEYQFADSWAEAVELLGNWGDEGKILAGGQSLVPMLNLRLAHPAALIDVNPIGPAEPAVDGDVLVLPALTRHQTVLRSDLVRVHCPLLPAAVALVGNVRVRARGTIGGSVCHADPTGEIPCVVSALRGRVVVQGPAGRRTVDADDFFLTYLTTALEPGEVVTEVRLPVRAPGEGWAFAETVRRASDFATVEVAAVVRMADNGRAVTDARVVLGGVADRPFVLRDDVLAPLFTDAPSTQRISHVGDAAADVVQPESDVHATADYRRRLTSVLTRRALTEAVERAGADR